MARKPPKGKSSAAAGGGKKKRAYTMSAEARAQRRAAGRKHGRRAATPERQLLPACKRSQCPLGEDAYPCTMKTTATEQGKPIESCPLPLVVDADLKRRYLAAIGGDGEQLVELAAVGLAAQATLMGQEMAKLQSEGFVIEQPAFVDNDGDVHHKRVVNPRAAPVFQTLENLGHTAAQQAITPKSAGEKKRDEGAAGMLTALEQLGNKLGGATVHESGE
jgi:hypothetical protein